MTATWVSRVSVVVLGAAVAASAGVGCQAQPEPPAAQGIWQVPMAISELYPLPPDGHAAWVELVNSGQEALSIGGWSLADRGGTRYVFPEDLPPVPGQGLVLVTFGNRVGATDDKSFEGDNVASLYARAEGASQSFRGAVNECALYAAPQPQPQQIVDYVCWGEHHDTVHALAAARVGLWAGAYGVSRAQPKPGEDESVVLSEGRSIGKVVFRKPVWVHDPETGEHAISPSGDWFIYIPQEVSPGRRNGWPSPILFAPYPDMGISQFQLENVSFICMLRYPRGWGEIAQWKTRLQVATDVEFRNLVMDVVYDAPEVYRHTPPRGGRYYWRARMEKGEEHSPWAPPSTFEILPD